MSTMDYKKGQQIMSCKPIVFALNELKRHHRCSWCFGQLKDNSIHCSDENHCFKFYCSERCKQEDWSDGHDVECGTQLRQFIKEYCDRPEIREQSDYLKFVFFDEWITHSELLVRLYIKLIRQPQIRQMKYTLKDGRQICYDDIEVPECTLMHPVWDDEKNCIGFEMDEVNYNFKAWKDELIKYLNLDSVKPKIGYQINEEILERAYQIIIRYTVYMMDEFFLQESGKAIYIPLCFIKHSCIPNCSPHYSDGHTLNIYTLNDESDFNALRFDFQVEIAGFPAAIIRETLMRRNIYCDCRRCLNAKTSKELNKDIYKELIDKNRLLGNWPIYDYSKYIRVHLDDAIANYRYHYTDFFHTGNEEKLYFHPWLTGLYFWKLLIELELIKIQYFPGQEIEFWTPSDIKYEEVIKTCDEVIKSVAVTHGNKWKEQLNAIGKLLVERKYEAAHELFVQIFDPDTVTTRYF